MRPRHTRRVRDLQQNPLMAAALVARDAQLAVRIVLADTPELVGEAQLAAEQAGVDVAVERTLRYATVHFVARHQDRRVTARGMRFRRFRTLVRLLVCR